MDHLVPTSHQTMAYSMAHILIQQPAYAVISAFMTVRNHTTKTLKASSLSSRGYAVPPVKVKARKALWMSAPSYRSLPSVI